MPSKFAPIDVKCEQITGVIMMKIFHFLGGELQSYVTNILEKLLAQIYIIQCPRTRSSTLGGILNLATHHSKVVCGILLNQPLPYDK